MLSAGVNTVMEPVHITMKKVTEKLVTCYLSCFAPFN